MENEKKGFLDDKQEKELAALLEKTELAIYACYHLGINTDLDSVASTIYTEIWQPFEKELSEKYWSYFCPPDNARLFVKKYRKVLEPKSRLDRKEHIKQTNLQIWKLRDEIYEIRRKTKSLSRVHKFISDKPEQIFLINEEVTGWIKTGMCFWFQEALPVIENNACLLVAYSALRNDTPYPRISRTNC